ncbi:MAG: DUF6114 domain-containing protein [Gordonia sp. (in: high G+C Gram-positive bacteria)]|uniref:DUF6114 domain-containing protein n=1 Tax=Gordonia sp. (in: high G+C Gram-positive bacteria) TaxID=84139 RepID=UPI003BB5DF88
MARPAEPLKKFFSDLRRWSKQRPAVGGILLVISAIFLGLPSLNGFRLGDLILTVSTISGVSTIVLSVLMALCAVSALFWLHARVLAGVAAMIIALVAFPAANFGGYFLGTLLGIIGAALILAWRPLEAAEASDDQPTEVIPTEVIPTEVIPTEDQVPGDTVK